MSDDRDDLADVADPSAPPPKTRPRRKGRSIVVTVIAVILVPALVIGLLESLPDDTDGLVGCRGNVRFKGQPLTMGTVTIRRDNATDDEPSSTGTIDENGWFTLTTEGKPGAPVGRHSAIVVLPNRASGPDIPTIYRSLESTPLSVDIQPESRFNVFTLDLKASGALTGF